MEFHENIEEISNKLGHLVAEFMTDNNRVVASDMAEAWNRIAEANGWEDRLIWKELD